MEWERLEILVRIAAGLPIRVLAPVDSRQSSTAIPLGFSDRQSDFSLFGSDLAESPL